MQRLRLLCIDYISRLLFSLNCQYIKFIDCEQFVEIEVIYIVRFISKVHQNFYKGCAYVQLQNGSTRSTDFHPKSFKLSENSWQPHI